MRVIHRALKRETNDRLRTGALCAFPYAAMLKAIEGYRAEVGWTECMSGMTILVVDDEPKSLRLLTDILAAEGYEVRPADSGETALSAIRAGPPELILLGLHMRGMDGFEVCRRMKAFDERREIPLIFMSTAAVAEERVEGLSLGAVDFLSQAAMGITQTSIDAKWLVLNDRLCEILGYTQAELLGSAHECSHNLRGILTALRPARRSSSPNL